MFQKGHHSPHLKHCLSLHLFCLFVEGRFWHISRTFLVCCLWMFGRKRKRLACFVCSRETVFRKAPWTHISKQDFKEHWPCLALNLDNILQFFAFQMYDEKRNIGIFIHNSLKLTYKAVAACTTPYYFGIHSFFPYWLKSAYMQTVDRQPRNLPFRCLDILTYHVNVRCWPELRYNCLFQ